MLPSVTTILSDGGVGFDMSHLPQEYSERGTLIHDYAHQRIMGCELPEVPDKWRGYANGVDSFQDRMDIYPIRHKGEYLMEATLVHPFKGFEGHIDLPAMNGIIPTIFDYKTGSIPEYTGPQLAGYELLLRVILPHIKKWRRVAILITKDGEWKPKEYTSIIDFAIFDKAYNGYFERRGVIWTHRN